MVTLWSILNALPKSRKHGTNGLFANCLISTLFSRIFMAPGRAILLYSYRQNASLLKTLFVVLCLRLLTINILSYPNPFFKIGDSYEK